MRAQYLSTKQAADMLSVSEWTLRIWLRKDTGPPATKLPNGQWRIDRKKLEQWMDTGEGRRNADKRHA
jgi:excisionase family DNA binding protein